MVGDVARQRDYRAEYQRRIERGLAAGLSRTQARRSGPSKAQDWQSSSRLLQNAFKSIQHGRYRSAEQAARELHLDPERLRGYMLATGQAHREAGRVLPGRAPGTRGGRHPTYHVPIISNGRIVEIDVNERNATLAGKYMGTVGDYIRYQGKGKTGEAIQAFRGQTITDLSGKTYTFETRLQTLKDIHEFESANWDEIYRRNG
ncbi:MAG: hypothetical protein KGJ45_11435 [Elusimicrobia bacterium]|nr:hypothetical protein [Elusimicrobiota bacterium]